MKRVLATILSIILVISIFSVGAFQVSARAEETMPDNAIAINSAWELSMICNEYPADGYYYLTTDIDLSVDVSENGNFYDDGKGWTPIGGKAMPFTGTFNGRGYTIKNLKIDRTTEYTALFGYVSGAEVFDLTVENSIVKGYKYVAGIIGGAVNSEIHNLQVKNCEISGSSNVGGIVGYGSNVTIHDCNVLSGTVKATSSYCGGIGGQLTNMSGITVSQCENSATVTGTSYLGGLFGELTGTSAVIDECFNAGNVSGTANNVAGVVGGAKSVTVKNCENTGSIESKTGATVTSVGGIAGDCQEVIKCINRGGVTATSKSSFSYNAPVSYVGGIAGEAVKVSNCFNDGDVYVAGGTYHYTTQGGGTYLGGGGYTIHHYDPVYTYGGGVAGNADTVERCYNTGIISSKENNATGALVSGNRSVKVSNSYSDANTLPLVRNSSNTITNCYNTNGIIAASGTATNCYYFADAESGIGGLRTKRQLRAKITYTDWDFDTVWTFDGNEDYLFPELIVLPSEFQKSVTSVSLVKVPEKTTYLEGKDVLDISQITLKLYYDNDTTEQINVTADMVRGFDNSTVGQKTITVTYQGFTNEFTVVIVAKSIVSIEMESLPTKLKYLEGKDEIDATGAKIRVHYNNGTTQVVNATQEMISGFDNTIVGTQILTVAYGGKTTNFEIEITPKRIAQIEMCTLPQKLNYIEGDEINLTGGKITIYYDNGTSEQLDLSLCDISDCELLEYGHREIVVSYQGFKTSFDVNIDHAFGDEYGRNDNYHWLVCSCGGTGAEEVHEYTNACDTDCNVCGDIRNVGDHAYTDACDTDCNVCGETRTIEHTFDNACDEICNVCGDYRVVGDHVYTDDCDTTCNECGDTRSISHDYKTTTTKATASSNGSIVKKCTVCGNVASSSTIQYAKTFTLSATSYTYNGTAKTPTVTVKRADGTTLTKNTHYTVTYASGRTNVGSYTVTVTGIGNYSFTKTLTFKVNPVSASSCTASLSATSYTYNGSVKTPTVTVKSPGGSTLTKGTSYTVSYASGRVNAGTYKVTITMKGNYTGTKTLTFKINPVSLGACKLSATSYTYNGSVKTPSVTVKNASGTTLTKGTSYTVTYASGRKNVGTYKVTIKGIGNYTGTKTLTFKINPASLGTCKLSVTSYTYNGSVKTPSVTVKNASGTTLTKNSFYTVTYASGRKNVGTYKVTIKGMGNYTGTKTLTFKINPASLGTCKLSATSYTYNGSVKTPTVTVKNASGTTLTKNSSYTVTYASGRKGVGTYKVTIKGIGNYTGTKTLTFTITPAAKTSVNLLIGDTTSAGAKSNKAITYSSSNSSIATVNAKGVITAKKAGTATINVKSNGVTRKITVTVKAPYVKVSGTSSMLIKKSVTLKATTNTGATVKWSSGNTSIAKVSTTGKVTGQKAGTATIYAKVTYKGKTYTGKYTVTVKNPTLSLDTYSKTIYVGETYTLKATTNTGLTVRYKSSNTSVATVSSSGRITPKAAGSATITAYFDYAGVTYKRTCTVTVKKSNFRLVKNYILANGYTDSNGNKYIGMYDTADDGTRYNFAITYDASRNSLIFESWTSDSLSISMEFEFKENQSYIDVEMYFEYGSVAKASVTYSLDVDTYNNDSGFTYYIRTQGYLDPSDYKELIGSFNDLGFNGWELVLQYKVGITLNDLGFDSFYA